MLKIHYIFFRIKNIFYKLLKNKILVKYIQNQYGAIRQAI